MTVPAVVDGSAVEVGPRTLQANEAIIEKGLGTFVEVGQALREIRDERQYRDAGFERFEDYLAARWDMSRPRGYQLIEAAEKAEIVSTNVDTAVPSEGVARALPREPERAREVWSVTVAEHGPKPTAAQVAEVRERVAPKPPAAPRKPVVLPEVKAKPMRPTRLPKDAELWTRRDIEAAQAIVDGRASAVTGTQVGTWLEKYDGSIDVWVDRAPWANPFVAGEDGDPQEVVALYAEHYLPFKAGACVADLRGKALRFVYRPGAEEHARYLASLANGEGNQW